jgi:hypothetical protein
MVPLKSDLVTSSGRNRARSRSVGNVANNVGARDILHWRVARRASDVGGATITLEDIIDPDTIDAGVSVGGTDEASKSSESVGEFDHFELLVFLKKEGF